MFLCLELVTGLLKGLYLVGVNKHSSLDV